TLRATDPEAGQGEGRVTVHIEGVPDHPTLEIVHPQVGEDGLEDWPFQFMARVSDRQDLATDLVLELESDPFGFVCYMVPDSNGVATCSEELPLGQHLLTFTVTDLDEFTVSQNRAFKVVSILDYDADGDGFTPNGGDCDDTNAQIYPGAPEICDGFDNDCNPLTAIDVGTDCYDDDGDGFCEVPPCVNASETLPDCNDAAPYIYPGAPELLDGYDNNCDGRVDEGTVVYDDDGDGYCESPPCINAAGAQSDCDDTNAAINPGRTESCSTAYDDNCDGVTNEQNATACDWYYEDYDGDGYYPPGAARECWCEENWGSGYTATLPNDCYDLNYFVHPGQGSYFTDHRGDGSYDYNCNYSTERLYPNIATTCTFSGSSLSCSGSSGWDGSPPACGVSEVWIDDCSFDTGNLIFGCVLPCALICLLFPDDCADCIIYECGTGALACDPEADSETQACR
ncbi:MAG: putative metal-binding motif-containing protein, partial [Deltaproteobacteria bacterium]|nr:putative metal-binding motif-containing protein [Deltaproteobacteria bacterium]